MALHPPFARLQNAEALIFVDGARHDCRLLAYDAFADHFGIDAISDGIVNQPSARQKLRCHRPTFSMRTKYANT